MGKDAVFHACDADSGELETLGGMKGHECDGARSLIPLVDVGHQCRRLQEDLEPAEVVQRVELLIGDDRSLIRAFELGSDPNQLTQVFNATHGLDGSLCLQVGQHPGVVENRLDSSFDATLLRLLPQPIYESDKLEDQLLCPRVELGDVDRLLQPFEEADFLRLRVTIDMSHCCVAYAAARLIDDALYRDLV